MQLDVLLDNSRTNAYQNRWNMNDEETLGNKVEMVN